MLLNRSAAALPTARAPPAARRGHGGSVVRFPGEARLCVPGPIPPDDRGGCAVPAPFGNAG